LLHLLLIQPYLNLLHLLLHLLHKHIQLYITFEFHLLLHLLHKHIPLHITFKFHLLLHLFILLHLHLVLFHL
ncbi:hypothetical protein SK128_004622, partial [Halocaridina rubra]